MKKEIKYYFYSACLINMGIAFVFASVIHVMLLDESIFYIFGIFIGSFLTAIGLLPFKMTFPNHKEAEKE